MGARAPYEQLLRWDAKLGRLGRGVGRFNLELGVALERLERQGWLRELGYSSMGGYALERCSRSGRWAAEAAALARRLERLPQLRATLVQGRVSLSMATLVSRHANAETDEFMTAKAQGSTVRAMRGYFRGWAVKNETVGGDDGDGDEGEGEGEGEGSGDAASEQDGSSAERSGEAASEDSEKYRLSVRVSGSDYLVLQRSLLLLRQLMGHVDDEALASALLAEADVSLLDAVPQVGSQADPDVEQRAAEQRQWEEVLSVMRAESERRCEQKFRGRSESSGGASADGVAKAQTQAELLQQHKQTIAEIEAARTPRELDLWIGARSRELDQRDLEIGQLASWFELSDGWSRLQYASMAQYARERVGLSPAALQSKQFVARRAAKLPLIREALTAGKIGFEAARQVARVATGETAEAWVERAGQRTVKHLREEVDVALWLKRSAGRSGCLPPSEEHMHTLAEAEQALLTGEAELVSDWPISSAESGGGASAVANPDGRNGASQATGVDGNGSWVACCGSGPSATQMSGGGQGARCDGEASQMSGGGASLVDDAATQMSGGGQGAQCDGEASQMSGGGASCSQMASEARKMKFRAGAPEGGRGGGMSSLGWMLGLVDEHGNPTAAHVSGEGGGAHDLEATLAALAQELCVGPSSGRGQRPGDVTITLWLTRETYWFWKQLEARAARWLPRTVSFVRFISLCIWNAHKYEVPLKVAYASIYARDRYRCTSPVCCKRTVQPHHLRKRSQGGGDEEENVAALCCDCHLEGVHAGRLTVEPPASRMLWSIGRDGGLVVLGRKKIKDVGWVAVGRGVGECAAGVRASR